MQPYTNAATTAQVNHHQSNNRLKNIEKEKIDANEKWKQEKEKPSYDEIQ